MVVPVILQLPLLVVAAVRVHRIMAVLAEVLLEGLLTPKRVMFPLAVVRPLEVLVVSLVLGVVLTEDTL